MTHLSMLRDHIVYEMIEMIQRGETFEDAVTKNRSLDWSDFEVGYGECAFCLARDNDAAAVLCVSEVSVDEDDSLIALWAMAEKECKVKQDCFPMKRAEVEVRVKVNLYVPRETTAEAIQEAITTVSIGAFPFDWNAMQIPQVLGVEVEMDNPIVGSSL